MIFYAALHSVQQTLILSEPLVRKWADIPRTSRFTLFLIFWRSIHVSRLWIILPQKSSSKFTPRMYHLVVASCACLVFIMYRISCLFVYLGLAANWSYVCALSGLVDYLRKLSFHSIFLYYHGCLCVDPSRPLWLLLLYRAGISIGFVRAFNPIIISIWIINTGCDSSKLYSQVIINLPSFVISNLFSRLTITCSSFADDLAAKMQSFV